MVTHDYDIISHLPVVKREPYTPSVEHAAESRNEFPFTITHATDKNKADHRRKFTILRPMAEHYKRRGEGTWMDEVGSKRE